MFSPETKINLLSYIRSTHPCDCEAIKNNTLLTKNMVDYITDRCGNWTTVVEYFLMQKVYSSSSLVRPISDSLVIIGCFYTLVKQHYFTVSEFIRVSGYTGGLYIALRKFDDFKLVLKTNV